MRTVQEYLEFERQCRELAAKQSNAEHKIALEQMAVRWAELEAKRQAKLAKEARDRL